MWVLLKLPLIHVSMLSAIRAQFEIKFWPENGTISIPQLDPKIYHLYGVDNSESPKI
jgi:hypothetical protein